GGVGTASDRGGIGSRGRTVGPNRLARETARARVVAERARAGTGGDRRDAKSNRIRAGRTGVEPVSLCAGCGGLRVRSEGYRFLAYGLGADPGRGICAAGIGADRDRAKPRLGRPVTEGDAARVRTAGCADRRRV